MFLNAWSLTLSLCSLIVLFLVGLASRTAIKVLRYWNPDSDSNRQIRLESEIWLSSTLVAYALGCQIISLILFVLAADNYCNMIVGAMCATGALLANNYGMPALLIKLAGIFFYGFWIVMHQLDIRSDSYPLVRVKYVYLLFLLPLLLADIISQTFYIGNLKPDIITSCCAVVFGSSNGSGSQSLIGAFPQQYLLTAFYAGAGLLLVLGLLRLRLKKVWIAGFFSLCWMAFFAVAIVTIISVLSSYIYAMPFHNCPFCIFKPQYNYIGFAIFGTLVPGAFFGISQGLVDIFRGSRGLAPHIGRYQRYAVIFSLTLLAAFIILSSYHYFVYKIAGGEV